MRRIVGWVRRTRDAIKRVEFALYVVTAVLGVYLAAGSVMRGAETPSKEFWQAGSLPFYVLIVSAVYVPLYALYKAVDAHFEAGDRSAADLSGDMTLACQQAVALLAGALPNLGVNDVSVAVWPCNDDGSFGDGWSFYLPNAERSTGVRWTRGRGVAGLAWEQGADIIADLDVLQRRVQGGAAGFDALPPGHRYSMSAEEVVKTSRHKVVAAFPLRFSGTSELSAVFVVRYMRSGKFAEIRKFAASAELNQLLGGIEARLTAARESK